MAYSTKAREEIARILPPKPRLLELVREKGIAEPHLEKKIDSWAARPRSEVPEGYATTVEAGRILGFTNEPDGAVMNRIRSGMIRDALKLEDGRTVVKLTEIARVKKILDERKGADNLTKLYRFAAKELGMTKKEVQTRIKDNGACFEIKDLYGNPLRVDIKRDRRSKPRITPEDAEILRVANEKKEHGLMEKAELATVLGTTEVEIDNLINAQRNVVEYTLLDGKVCDIRIVFEGRRNRYVREDVEALKKQEACGIKTSRQIADALGITPHAFTHFTLKIGHLLEFELNGKQYRIEFKHGKGNGLYVYENELEELVKWWGVAKGITHQRIGNEYESGLVNGALPICNRRLPLCHRGNHHIAIPLDELDGKYYVPNDYASVPTYARLIRHRLAETRMAVISNFWKKLSRATEITDEMRLKAHLTIDALRSECNDEIITRITWLLRRKNMKAALNEPMDRQEAEAPLVQIRRSFLASMPFAGAVRLLDVEPALEFAPDYGFAFMLPENAGGIYLTITTREEEFLRLYAALYENGNEMGVDAAHRFLDEIKKFGLGSHYLKSAAIVMVREFAIKLDVGIIGKRARELLSRLGNGVTREGKYLQVVFEKAMNGHPCKTEYMLSGVINELGRLNARAYNEKQ